MIERFQDSFWCDVLNSSWMDGGGGGGGGRVCQSFQAAVIPFALGFAILTSRICLG